MKYATTTSTASRAGHSDWAARVSALTGALRRYVKAWEGRRAAHRLLTLDDHLLKDIGLRRSEVEAALSAPWDIDPSVVLSVTRRRRVAADDRYTADRRRRGMAPAGPEKA